MQWPATGMLELDAPHSTDQTRVSMLGLSVDIKWKPRSEEKGIVIEMPTVPVTQIPSQWAWVFKLTGVM